MKAPSKTGFAVRLVNGEWRGIYRDPNSARIVADLATVCEFQYFDPPTVERVRMPIWKRYGTKAQLRSK